MKKCKFCSEEIQDDAIKCKHCGEMLNSSELTTFFALILGLIGMVAWYIPVIGFPIQLLGILLSRNCKSSLAKNSLILCLIGLSFTIINASIGAYQGYQAAEKFNKSLEQFRNY